MYSATFQVELLEIQCLQIQISKEKNVLQVILILSIQYLLFNQHQNDKFITWKGLCAILFVSLNVCFGKLDTC